MAQKHKANKHSSLGAWPKINPWSIFIIIVSLVALYGLIPQLKQLSGTFAALRTASTVWILAGIAMMVVLFLASGYTQYVVCRGMGSYKKLTVLELTGAFLDHFLPFNSGSVSLIARYYRQLGMAWARALTVAVLPTILGMIITVSLVLVISPLTLTHLFHRAYDARLAWLALGVALFVGSGLVMVVAPLRKRAKSLIMNIVKQINSISLWPQFAQVAAGCIILRFSGGLALAFSVYSIHASISIIDAFTLFVAAQIVSSLSPTPGGVGTTDAFVVFGLVSVGLGLPQAVAASLIFRLITFWLPILPGIIAVRLAYRWQVAG